MVDPDKPVTMKIYIEGHADMDSKMVSLKRGVLCSELRQKMATKLNVDPNSFWIFLQKDMHERNVAEHEALLTVPEKEVVTVKMVEGSHYYTFQGPTASKLAPGKKERRRSISKKKKK